MAKTTILNSRFAVEDCDAVMPFCADAHAENKDDGRSCSSLNEDKKESGRPIIVDLDGNGIESTELSESIVFMDADGVGLLNRTAWADDGVLFFDPDDKGVIEETRQYIFTEWDPTATSDMEALQAVFDSNGDWVSDCGTFSATNRIQLNRYCDHNRSRIKIWEKI